MINIRQRLAEAAVRSWLRPALDPERPVRGQRRMVQLGSRLLPPLRGVTVTSETMGGRPVLWLQTREDRGPGVILYLHGGGYVLGSPGTHQNIGARLARLTGLPVVIPDYRLAPEARWPAAREDACAAWRALRKSDGSGTAATMAVAVSNPTPGTCIRWAASDSLPA